MNVVCIDPGIVAVGLVHARVSDTFDLEEIFVCARVDLTRTGGSHLHTYISNFFDAHERMLAEATHIVLERQPVQSAGMPLELLFRERYADKCVFVSPQTLHKHFGLQDLEYDGRKAKCVGTVLAHLTQWQTEGLSGAERALHAIETLDRKHDVCDAFLLLCYWLVTQRRRVPKPTHDNVAFADFVERFRLPPRLPTRKNTPLT